MTYRTGPGGGLSGSCWWLQSCSCTVERSLLPWFTGILYTIFFIPGVQGIAKYTYIKCHVWNLFILEITHFMAFDRLKCITSTAPPFSIVATSKSLIAWLPIHFTNLRFLSEKNCPTGWHDSMGYLDASPTWVTVDMFWFKGDTHIQCSSSKGHCYWEGEASRCITV